VLPTTPITPDSDEDRLRFRALGEEAISQLEAAGTERFAIETLAEAFAALVDDDDVWRFQARSLVVFATPENLVTYRLPTSVEPLVAVSDRFHLKPLLRATSFGNSGYVLALADGGVRLIKVSADLPAATVKLALRDHLSGQGLPLVLAAVESLGAIYRSVNTYPHLVSAGLKGSPEHRSDGELAQSARPVFDAINSQRLADWREVFGQRPNEGRASSDVTQVARAATFEAVAAGSGGEVLSVRKEDLPDGAPVAAIFRYAL
jgi:hypothetical protein